MVMFWEIVFNWNDTLDSLQQQVLLLGLTFMASIVLTKIPSGSQLFPSGERPTRSSRGRRKVRRSSFSLAKLLFGIPLVYLAAFALSSLFVDTQKAPLLQILTSLVGYMCLLRWTHIDQNRRCPTCLKRLSSPIHLGRPSWALLDWKLQEYICTEGHGVMQVPIAPLMGQFIQEWLPLT
jgi:hypothetical protein